MTEERVRVEINSGILEGLILPNEYGNSKYFSFQGIPYGTAKRFQPPEPVGPWKGVKEAVQDGDSCYFSNWFNNERIGSENCLNLNVFTPDLPADNAELLPVMVFIHGGAFTMGSNSKSFQGPEFLIRENVVLVVVNYRLGLLGSLHLNDPELNVPGNNAFRDVILSLKWVQRNIRSFNGDPNNVTIFGESAGGALTHLLVLSPLTKGLFHKAIAQSGCALNAWTACGNTSEKLSKFLGINDEKQLLRILLEMPLDQLYDLQKKLPDHWTVNEQRCFGYVVENQNQKIEPFLHKDPLEIIETGDYVQIPMIFGFTSMEGMFLHLMSKKKFTELMPNVEDNVPYNLNLERGSNVSKRAANEILHYYFGNEEPYRNLEKSYLMLTDNMFVRDILKAARTQAETSKAPVYLYQMNLVTSLNFMKSLSGITAPGACHGDDLGYLFRMPFHNEIVPNSEEDVNIRRFCRMWTNFAKFSDPNLGSSASDSSLWKPFDGKNQFYLEIDRSLNGKTDVLGDRMRFWDEIYAKFRKIEHKL